MYQNFEFSPGCNNSATGSRLCSLGSKALYDFHSVVIKVRNVSSEADPHRVLSLFEDGAEVNTQAFAKPSGVFIPTKKKQTTGEAFIVFPNAVPSFPDFLGHVRERTASLNMQCRVTSHTELINAMFLGFAPPMPNYAGQQDYQETTYTNWHFSACPFLPPFGRKYLPKPPLPPHRPQQNGQRSASKTWIVLRGLPYKASLEDIEEFMKDYKQYFLRERIVMFVNKCGLFTGTAAVEMTSESATLRACTDLHCTDITCSGKNRYVEVYRCTPDEALKGSYNDEFPVQAISYVSPMELLFGRVRRGVNSKKTSKL